MDRAGAVTASWLFWLCDYDANTPRGVGQRELEAA
jgi:hypothetical protein